MRKGRTKNNIKKRERIRGDKRRRNSIKGGSLSITRIHDYTEQKTHREENTKRTNRK